MTGPELDTGDAMTTDGETCPALGGPEDGPAVTLQAACNKHGGAEREEEVFQPWPQPLAPAGASSPLSRHPEPRAATPGRGHPEEMPTARPTRMWPGPALPARSRIAPTRCPRMGPAREPRPAEPALWQNEHPSYPRTPDSGPLEGRQGGVRLLPWAGGRAWGVFTQRPGNEQRMTNEG